MLLIHRLRLQRRRQFARLLGRRRPADHGIVTIKVLGDLLQRRVARLNVEEPHHRQLDAQPHAVEDVVFPLDGV